MSLFRYLPAAIMSAMTANPAPLLAQAGGDVVTQATGSPIAGKVASIAGGNITDPSNIAPALIKEAGTTALEKTGPTGQAISTGIQAGSTLKDVTTAPEQAIKPSGTSSFKQALPYLALAGPALASLAKTGKITPGLEAGGKLLQGMSAIQSMEVQKAQEKDRVAKSSIEIKNLQAEDALLSKEVEVRETDLYKGASESQKPVLDEIIKLHAPNGKVDGRTMKHLSEHYKYNVDFKTKMNEAENLDNQVKSNASYKKYLNAVEKFGKDSVEAKVSHRDYLKDSKIYEEGKDRNTREIDQIRKRETSFEKLKEKFTSVSVEALKKDPKSQLVPIEKTGTAKTAANYMLPSGDIVLSQDGGRTYLGEGGESTTIPTGTVKVPAGATLAEINAQKARQQAQAEISIEKDETITTDQVEAALGGTGPYATLKAAIDNIAGGLGVDKIFGKEGLFPDTQANRQQLRLIKQTGKAALLNSARGAVWEQERIDQLFPNPDTIFTNPRTEAKKFDLLRETVITEKSFNNQAIASATSPKEIEKLRSSNHELNLLLKLIGEPEIEEPEGGLSKEDRLLIDKYKKR